MSDKKINNLRLNLLFMGAIFLVSLIALEAVPRYLAWLVLVLVLFHIIFTNLAESSLLFIRLIPFFIALPIMTGFDSLNIWRLAVIALVLKWFMQFRVWHRIKEFLKQAPKSLWGFIKHFYRQEKFVFYLLLWFILISLSVSASIYPVEALKRVIYLANLWLLFFVLKEVISQYNLAVPALKSLLIGGVLTMVIGILQFISAYVLFINEFVMLWAGMVQKGFYGTNWSNIALGANTWFAYSHGNFPRLRLFSSFPDSHSFPLFLLMCLPGLLFFARKRKIVFYAILILGLLLAVLSGTRGVWLAVLVPLSVYLFLLMRKRVSFKWSRQLLAVFVLFLLFIPLATALLTSVQFRFGQEENEAKTIMLRRMLSTFDASELSNQGRLYIWQKSFESIIKNPLLGIGIGNFAYAIGEDISAMKAGASAHNLYLNVAVETGLISGLVFLLILYLILQKNWQLFQAAKDKSSQLFSLSLFLVLIWISVYSLTDAVLFDERVFLGFLVLVSIIFGLAPAQKKVY